MKHVTDEDLALAIRASESGAFERLVARYQDALFGFALRLLQNEFDAEEVVQDTVLRAHRALSSKYDEHRIRAMAIRPWLFRIARNAAINRQRTRRRHSVSTGQDLDSMAAPGPVTANDGECELLQKVLAGLDRAERELLELRFFQELPYSQIAAVVGGTDSALRGRIYRTLRKLRDRLERMGYTQWNAKT